MASTSKSINKQVVKPEKKAYLSSVTLIIISFVTVFFPRIISAAGVPKVINFVHFLAVPFALVVAIAKTPTKNKKQIAITWEIITACMVLLAVMLASALFNQAGIINVFLDFMILAEGFLMLLAIVCIPLTPAGFKKLRTCLLVSALINLVVALVQKPLIDAHLISTAQYTPEDAIQGVFYLSGAGNYVSCAVSLAVGMYYFMNAKTASIWIRGLLLFAAFYQLLLSDSKQVLIAFVASWVLLLFFKYNAVDKALMYLITIVVLLSIFYWCIENVEIESLEAYKWWFSRTELYGPNGEAVHTKFAAVPMILSYYKSPINWLFGLGPGHTVGRLGGWFFRDYWSLLGPLGATTHPVTGEVWAEVLSNWLDQESSAFMPLFSWLGIWGDLGFVGLGSYLYLAYVVWSRLCLDDFSRFLMLTMFVFGVIFTQMEEPGQTISVAMLIGLQWHERRLAKEARYHA